MTRMVKLILGQLYPWFLEMSPAGFPVRPHHRVQSHNLLSVYFMD